MDEERLRSLGLVDAERLLDEIHLWECLSARDAEGYDDVHLFVDKSGVRLASFMTSENGGGGGEFFSFDGEGGHAARVFAIRPGLALVDLRSAGSASRTILVEVDDPQVYPHHGLRGPGCALELDDFRLGAIATRFEVVEDEEAFLAVQARRGDDAVSAAPGRLVSRSILALTEGAASPREVNAEAEFLALCLDVDHRINSVTGLPWLRLRADCGLPIALALPGDCEPRPQPGSLILGRAILVGSSGFWDRGEPFVERLT